jgi:hypothetical protein
MAPVISRHQHHAQRTAELHLISTHGEYTTVYHPLKRKAWIMYLHQLRSNLIMYDLKFSQRWLWRVLTSGMSCSSLKVNLYFGGTFYLVFCFVYSSTLKMEATCSPETSIDFQRTTKRSTLGHEIIYIFMNFNL